MIITIGELVNEVAQYGSIYGIQVIRGKPFLRATINNASGYAKGYLYIIQRSQRIYSIYDDNTDQHGRRVLPSTSGPYDFVTEVDEGRAMCDRYYTDHFHGHMAMKLSYFKALWHYYHRLIAYDVVSVQEDTFDRRFDSIGFNSSKIKQTIERAFHDRNTPGGTIRDLVEIVNHRNDTFNLGPLKARELNCVIGKLQELGLNPDVADHRITHIKFRQT